MTDINLGTHCAVQGLYSAPLAARGTSLQGNVQRRKQANPFSLVVSLYNYDGIPETGLTIVGA